MSSELKNADGAVARIEAGAKLGWATGDVARVPYKAFFDSGIYTLEQDRVFRGPVWSYVALEAELPNPGDFKASFVGETPIFLTRDRDGQPHGFVNQCAHRGALVCRLPRGNSTTHVCIYHQWSYDLEGNLIGVPFRHGIEGKGGYDAGFEKAEHGLQKLRVASYAGLIFVSFSAEAEPLEQYLGAEMCSWLDRTLNRPLRVLGFARQLINGNWKLYAENVRDPYHGSLLHLFNARFGIARVSQYGGVTMDESGRHNVIHARKRAEALETAAYASEKIRPYETSFGLSDPTLLVGIKERGIDTTTSIQSIFPNLVVQQISSSLATRQFLPKGAGRFELISTFLSYADDDDATVRTRLKQANLAGPAGYISMEDGYAIELVQQAIVNDDGGGSFIELGGVEARSRVDLVTEAPIRGFWSHYKHLMESAL